MLLLSCQEEFKSKAKISLALSILLATLAPALGQVETARITGTIKDTTGAVIPGVEIVITHVGTNRQIRTITDDSGRYASVPIAIGEYRVEAAIPGCGRETSAS